MDSPSVPSTSPASEPWTVPEVVGDNVRRTRIHRSMSQADLGRSLGDALGKPLPRQTVALMERGGRAFVAAEVVALAYILDVPIVNLYQPPDGVTDIAVSEVLTLAASDWTEQPSSWKAATDMITDLTKAVQQLRTIESIRASLAEELERLAEQQERAFTALDGAARDIVRRYAAAADTPGVTAEEG